MSNHAAIIRLLRTALFLLEHPGAVAEVDVTKTLVSEGDALPPAELAEQFDERIHQPTEAKQDPLRCTATILTQPLLHPTHTRRCVFPAGHDGAHGDDTAPGSVMWYDEAPGATAHGVAVECKATLNIDTFNHRAGERTARCELLQPHTGVHRGNPINEERTPLSQWQWSDEASGATSHTAAKVLGRLGGAR